MLIRDPFDLVVFAVLFVALAAVEYRMWRARRALLWRVVFGAVFGLFFVAEFVAAFSDNTLSANMLSSIPLRDMELGTLLIAVTLEIHWYRLDRQLHARARNIQALALWTLRDFPRPVNDNGRGMHFGLDVRQQNLDGLMPVLRDMGVKWCVFYSGDELQTANCVRAALTQGIMPIIRPKGYVDGTINWDAHIKSAQAAGIPNPYIQIYNEPGDRREWKDGKPKRDMFISKWREAAQRVVACGGLPGLNTFEAADVRDCLTGLDPSILSRFWFASHAYASNHPTPYPSDKNQTDYDDACALRWIAEAEWCKAVLGYYPPVIVAEGGYLLDQSEDNTYPRIDADLHAKYSVEIFDWFRGKLSNGWPLPDHFFAYCPWILYDADYVSWIGGPLGGCPKTVDAVKAMPTFVRRSSWDSSPTPTPDPTPEPTPTPTPTPAPILAKSKLGIYVINCGDLPIDWFAQAQPVIAMSMDHNPDYWREVKRVSPGTMIIGRYYADTQSFDDPENQAQAFFNQMRPCVESMRGIYETWMSYNEPAIWNEDDARRLSRFTVAWSNLMHGLGVKTVAYSFSEGHPDLSLWPFLVEGVRACDYLGLHEYDAPEMNRTFLWRCCRYRQVLAALPADLRQNPIIIGETGIDGGVSGVDRPQCGWKVFGDAAHYLESLKWYDSQLQIDANAIGAAVFAAKWDTGNGSYNVADVPQIKEYIGMEQQQQQTAGQLAVAAALAKKPWWPINTGAALYKYAQAEKMGYPQSDEFPFTADSADYIGQVYSGGIVYVKKGDWGNCHRVAKPEGV
jgi:hypothetical protein